MTIQYAILGLLNWKPLSGYDLKKIISNSDAFYWSGNNNQIYHTLAQLHKDEMVTLEVHFQKSLPAKKLYSTTEKGREELYQWLLSTPPLPELRNPFLIQLAWSDLLADAEVEALLSRYEEEIEVQLRMQQEKIRRDFRPDRTLRETYLWGMISENIISNYQNELEWVRRVKGGLANQAYQNEHQDRDEKR